MSVSHVFVSLPDSGTGKHGSSYPASLFLDPIIFQTYCAKWHLRDLCIKPFKAAHL